MEELTLTPNGEKVLRKVMNYFKLEVSRLYDTFQTGKKEDKATAIAAARDELAAIEQFLYILNSMKDINAEERLYIRKKLYTEFYEFVEQYRR